MSKPSLKIVRNEAQKSAEIYLYGIIGDNWYYDNPLTARKFQQQLAALSDVQEIHVHINSPGGDVHEGLAISNAISASRKTIHTWNDGICASMGAVILCSAKAGNRHAAKGSLTMLHSASTVSWGNSAEMRETADMLDKHDEVLAEIIADAAGQTVDQIRAAYMDGADHWLTAKDAEALGLITIEDYQADDMPENATAMNMGQVAAFYGKKTNQNPQIKNENMFGTTKFKALTALAKVADAASITPEQVKAVNEEIEAEKIPGVTLVLDSALQTVNDRAVELETANTALEAEKVINLGKITALEAIVAEQKTALDKKPGEAPTTPKTTKTDETPAGTVLDVFETSFDREVKALKA